MKNLNRITVDAPRRAEKVLMYGEGNFLRAFAALLIDRLNQSGVYDGGVVALQGTKQGLAGQINAQDGLYHVIERGVEGGVTVNRSTLVGAVTRCVDPYIDYGQYIEIAHNPELELIISNTTEFGICYEEAESRLDMEHANFPAKLTDFLYRRYEYFLGAADKGLIILPCELIDKNADKLKELVVRYATEWGLSQEFLKWLNDHNIFANTLVDRIVSGYPKDEAAEICAKLGFDDKILSVCEPFFLWAVEGDSRITDRVPLDKGGLNVVITDNLEFYRTRKVRILNGAHTMSVAAGHLAGLTTVEQLIKDKDFELYVNIGLNEEIIPCMKGEGLYEYADDVKERFLNPYLNHLLLSIALNSVSKFKSRVLPSIEDYCRINGGKAPKVLSFGLAALIAFYRQGIGSVVNDEKQYTDRFTEIFNANKGAAEIVALVLAEKAFWGKDLAAEYPALKSSVTKALELISDKGLRAALSRTVN